MPTIPGRQIPAQPPEFPLRVNRTSEILDIASDGTCQLERQAGISSSNRRAMAEKTSSHPSEMKTGVLYSHEGTPK